MPGGAGDACPSWVPGPLVAAAMANRKAIDTVAALMELTGSILSSSVVLAPTGVPLGAVGAVLSSLSNGCDLGDTLKAQAKAAALGAKIGAVVFGVAGAVAIIPPATPAAIPLAAAAAGMGALAPVFDALGQGKAPKLSDVAKVAQMLPGLQNLPVAGLTGPIDKSIAQLAQQALQSGPLKSLLGQVAGAMTLDPESAGYANVHEALVRSVSDASQAAHLGTNISAAAAHAPNTVKSNANAFLTHWRDGGSPTGPAAVAIWNDVVDEHPVPADKLGSSLQKAVAKEAAKAKAHYETQKASARTEAKAKAHRETQKAAGQDTAKAKAHAMTLARDAGGGTMSAAAANAELVAGDGFLSRIPTWAKVVAGVVVLGGGAATIYAVTR